VSITVHVGAHPDALVGALCDELAVPGGGPFDAEVVAVPTRGIERWLTQQIAVGLAARGVGAGICANVRFPSPGELVRTTLEGIPELADAAGAWDPDRLTDVILDVLDAELDRPWLGHLGRYVDGGPGNRLAAAAKIARLFDRYQRRRPGMIRRWAAGDDAGPDGRSLDDARWQPMLWREVRDRLGVPAPAELLPEALGDLERHAASLDLPRRVGVYGLTGIDPYDLDVLVALGEVRDVHLYVLHPSPALWETVADRLTPGGTLPSRHDDPTADAPRHPLLVSWGRESRELQTVLASRRIDGRLLPAGTAHGSSLLATVQEDIRRDRPPRRDDRIAAAVGRGEDRSVQIHVCHGARRQAEVARDAILHALAADPTLEPRDVVIMTPDLDTFAPLLEAAFPHDDGSDLPDLRLRIADRAPAVTNPLVRFVATVMDLVDGRLEAGTVRELVRQPVVQQRFGFDADTAAAIVQLIDDANVSWGLDAADRQAWRAGTVAQRTWGRGLDRLLAGVFYADDATRVVGDVAPVDGIEGEAVDAAGFLAAILDRVRAVRGLLGEPRPRSAWAEALATAVGLLAAPGWDDEWQLGQLGALLRDSFPPTEAGRPDPLVSLAEARRAVAWWTSERPSPLHFRTGDITVCTLAPMRSVPYRVVCLVGMDDERFPRSGHPDGDDLLVDHELVGDPDPSARDRQLLLDALVAAGSHLIVVYSGRDELTNAELPPAVPIAELVETLEAMVGTEAMRRVVTHHPLQPFADVNFRPGALGTGGPWAFDPEELAAARAALDGRKGQVPLPPTWPPPEPLDEVRLVDLIDCLQHPVRRFMRERLGFTVPRPRETPDDLLPVDLGPLARWQMESRLLDGLFDGHDVATLVARHRAADDLPPGSLADDDIDEAVTVAEALHAAAVAHGYDPARMEPRRGVVPVGEWTVEGSVRVDPVSRHLAAVTPSKIKARHRLRAYAELVFLTALDPSEPWTALLVGRREKGGLVAVTIGPVGGATPHERQREAADRLATLVDLYGEGRARPLPMPCETSYAWQRKLGAGRPQAFREAMKQWQRDPWSGVPREAEDPAHEMLLPGAERLRVLLDLGLERYAGRLWAPILPLMRERSA